jgi:hypothetical protein
MAHVSRMDVECIKNSGGGRVCLEVIEEYRPITKIENGDIEHCSCFLFSIVKRPFLIMFKYSIPTPGNKLPLHI